MTKKRLDRNADIFNRAVTRAALRKRITIEPNTDHVIILMDGSKPMRFTIGRDGSIFGPETTIGVGNINDDGIEDLIAKAIVNEIPKQTPS